MLLSLSFSICKSNAPSWCWWNILGLSCLPTLIQPTSGRAGYKFGSVWHNILPLIYHFLQFLKRKVVCGMKEAWDLWAGACSPAGWLQHTSQLGPIPGSGHLSSSGLENQACPLTQYEEGWWSMQTGLGIGTLLLFWFPHSALIILSFPVPYLPDLSRPWNLPVLTAEFDVTGQLEVGNQLGYKARNSLMFLWSLPSIVSLTFCMKCLVF